MPEPVVVVRLAASPAAVLASLTGHVAAQGGELLGVDGFGSIVTWRAFDGQVELVTMRAEIIRDDEPGITRLVVRRVDAALQAALDALATQPGDPAADSRDAG